MTMKKSWGRCAMAALALAAAGSAAQAAVYTDTFKPAGSYDLSPASFSLNIKTASNDGFGAGSGITEAYGFNAALETITSATLSIWLADDDSSDSAEYANFFLDGSPFTFSSDGSPSDEVDGGICGYAGAVSDFRCRQYSYDLFTLTGASLISLLGDGMVTGSVTADAGGDFWFKGAAVTVTTTQRVPEPATLGLLGMGLAGVGFARRRKSQKA